VAPWQGKAVISICSSQLPAEVPVSNELIVEELLDPTDVLSGLDTTGVFLLRWSRKFTPLEIRLEKFRLRLRPKRGLCEWPEASCEFLFSSFRTLPRRGPGRVFDMFFV
jgi:hypothetical protein